MTRSMFGGTSSDVVLDTRDRWLKLAEVTLTLWDSPVGGNRYTDLLDHTGARISAIRTPGGQVPVFQGPDGVTEMWADDGDNSRHLMLATDAQGIAAIRDETVQAAASIAREEAGGVAGLDTSGKLYLERIPAGVVKAGDLVINVKDYGAVGDGAADDTTKIQAALNAAGNASGGTVLVPRGTYAVSTLTLPARVHLIGQGGARIRQRPAATNHLIVVPVASTHVLIRDLELDGNKAAVTATAHGIETRAPNTAIENCYVHDTKYDGIHLGTGAHFGRASGNRVLACGRYGINVLGTAADPVRHVMVRDNYIEGSNDSALGIMGVGSHVSFVGNTCRLNGEGAGMYNPANRHIVFSHNLVEDSGNNGVHLGGRYLTVVGNHIYSPTNRGVYIRNSDGSASSDFVISGNSIESPGIQGIYTENTDSGTITGNRVNLAGGNGIECLSGDDIAVSGNVVQGSTGSGIYLTDVVRATVTGCVTRANAVRGIGITGATSADTIVTGCIVEGNAGNGIHSSGSPAPARLRIQNNIVRNNTAGDFGVTPATGNVVGPNSTSYDLTTAVPSASALSIPAGTQGIVTVSGTTAVTSLSGTGGSMGRIITLRFTGACQVTDGGNINLAGNFVGPGTLSVYSDGANWFEVSRATVI